MTAFALKIIAIVAMTFDHLGATIFLDNVYLRAIGRLTYPIMAFLISEGYRHTSNKTKYLFRLILFAVLSEIPFDMAFNNAVFEFSSQNVMLTLALGLCAIWLYDINRKSIFKVFYPFIMCILAEVLATDYSSVGVMLIFVMYLIPQNKPLYLLAAIIGFCTYFSFGNLVGFTYKITPYSIKYIMLPLAAIFSAIPILLYNKKRGYNIKYFFYIYYPLHLFIIAIISANNIF